MPHQADIQAIIDFLTEILAKQQLELAKYQGYKTKYHLISPFVDIAIHAVEQRIVSTQKSLDYYNSLPY